MMADHRLTVIIALHAVKGVDCARVDAHGHGGHGTEGVEGESSGHAVMELGEGTGIRARKPSVPISQRMAELELSWVAPAAPRRNPNRRGQALGSTRGCNAKIVLQKSVLRVEAGMPAMKRPSIETVGGNHSMIGGP